jgi:hypothetical protein
METKWEIFVQENRRKTTKASKMTLNSSFLLFIFVSQQEANYQKRCFIKNGPVASKNMVTAGGYKKGGHCQLQQAMASWEEGT